MDKPFLCGWRALGLRADGAGTEEGREDLGGKEQQKWTGSSRVMRPAYSQSGDALRRDAANHPHSKPRAHGGAAVASRDI